jgi:hypothetical protein
LSYLLLISHLPQNFKVIPRIGVVGIDLQNPFPVNASAGVLPFVVVGNAPVKVRLGKIGVYSQRLIIVCYGFVMLS